MKAYFIHAGVWWDYYDNSIDLTCDVVFALTRGRAKSLFYQKYKRYMDDYISIKLCRLLAKDVDRVEGCSEHNDFDDKFWELVPGEWGNLNI